MAALAVLAAITAVFFLLFAGLGAIALTIKHVDKQHGALRDKAPTALGQGVLTVTGAHAARWGGDGPVA
jgi:hypothetical protein